MTEGDDEDLWFKCLDTAFGVLGAKGKTRRYAEDYTEFADVLYDACKAKTKKVRKEKDPQATVVQMK